MSWPYLSFSPGCRVILNLNDGPSEFRADAIDQDGIVIHGLTENSGNYSFYLMFAEIKTTEIKGQIVLMRGIKRLKPIDRRDFINAIWESIKLMPRYKVLETIHSQAITPGKEIWAILSGLTDSPLSSWLEDSNWPEVTQNQNSIWNVGQALLQSSRKIVMVGQSQAMTTLRSQVLIGLKNKGMLNIYGPVGSGRETLVKVIHEESGHDQQLHFVRDFSELEESIKLAPLTPQLYYIKDVASHEIEEISEISKYIAGQGSRLIVISENPIDHPLLKSKICVPSIKERFEDKPILIKHFINHYAHLFHFPEPLVTEEAFEMLINHECHGEIKELKSLCNQIVGLCGHSGIVDAEKVEKLIQINVEEEIKKVA